MVAEFEAMEHLDRLSRNERNSSARALASDFETHHHGGRKSEKRAGAIAQMGETPL